MSAWLVVWSGATVAVCLACWAQLGQLCLLAVLTHSLIHGICDIAGCVQ